MRRLIYVPVIHTQADMGSLAEAVSRAYRERYGVDKWRQHRKLVADLWQGIAERIDALYLDWTRLKVYQDGLPVCGQEERIVTDLAGKGSLNHILVRNLIDGGATLIGTESAELLIEEYNLIKDQLHAAEISGSAPGSGDCPEDTASGKALTERRDRFVAGRIEETLREGETGILFMGLLHEVHRYLSEEIQVDFLVHRLPLKWQRVRKTGSDTSQSPAIPPDSAPVQDGSSPENKAGRE